MSELCKRKAFLLDTGSVPARNVISIEPPAGTMPADRATTVTVKIDETRLQPGAHSAAVHLHTSDPSESHIEIPMEL